MTTFDDNITRWVRITISMCPDKAPHQPDYNGPKEILFMYDLPRDVYERRKWVIQWRYSWFVCQYPRRTINLSHGYYEKETELDLTYNGPLNNLIAAKRMITKTTNALEQYKASKAGEMFNDFEQDPLVIKALEKIKKYEIQRDSAQAEVNAILESRQK